MTPERTKLNWQQKQSQSKKRRMQPEKSMKDYYAARAHEFDRVYAKPERQNDLRYQQSDYYWVFQYEPVAPT